MSIEAVLSGARAWHIECGDALDVLRTLPEHSSDACVTDPPYGIGIMGKAWDQFSPSALQQASADYQPIDIHCQTARPASMHAGTYDQARAGHRRFQPWCEAWAAEVLRVLKPGGHILAFGGTRTCHRLVAGMEDAGFEIRDQLAWLFGSGFPQNHDLGDGWGTALKPGHEPIVLARAPLSEKTIAANIARWGTGGLNIDGTRLPSGARLPTDLSGGQNARPYHEKSREQRYAERGATSFAATPGPRGGDPRGRWPANVTLDEEAAALLDEQTGTLTSGAYPTRRGSDKFRDVYGEFAGQIECDLAGNLDSGGGASRFFYCAKAGRAERNVGLDGFAETSWSDGRQAAADHPRRRARQTRTNHHPTVKPIALMQWLIRLITPKAGLVLDPFAGSGTTGIAALREGDRFLGIEREAEYVAIARARIEGDAPLLNTLFEPDAIKR